MVKQGEMVVATKKRPGLYANIHAKRKRIKAGSGETMRKKGQKGRPTAAQFKRAGKATVGSMMKKRRKARTTKRSSYL